MGTKHGAKGIIFFFFLLCLQFRNNPLAERWIRMVDQKALKLEAGDHFGNFSLLKGSDLRRDQQAGEMVNWVSEWMTVPSGKRGAGFKMLSEMGSVSWLHIPKCVYSNWWPSSWSYFCCFCNTDYFPHYKMYNFHCRWFEISCKVIKATSDLKI